MRRHLPIMIALLVVATVVGCSSETAVTQIEPSIIPTSAQISLVESELAYGVDASISPSGNARVAPSTGEWCLEDANGLRCLSAAAEGSSSHGIVWRPDEQAIAVTWGRQDPISIIDFAAGTVVETDLDKHRLLAWSPDGAKLLGLDSEREGVYSLIDPISLDAEDFQAHDTPGVPQIAWVTQELIWGTSPFEPLVFTFSQDDDAQVVDDGGLGDQQFLSVTPDGRLALTSDTDVDRGRGDENDSLIRIFDREGNRSANIMMPPGFGSVSVADAQLSDDGQVILMVHRIDGIYALSSSTLDEETLSNSAWTTLFTWPGDDANEPAGFVANGTLRWNGGTTAWIISDSERLIEVTLS